VHAEARSARAVVQLTGDSCTLTLVPPRRKTAEPGTVIGYVRVSTDDQAESGLGLEAQRVKLADECARRGWTLVAVAADEGLSGKEMLKRPELNRALDRIEEGDAQILMVSKLDRISRSVYDFSGLLKRAEKRRWVLVAADIGIDMSTPAGEAMANVMASFAQLERRLIGQRTSDALQVKKRQGVVLGRPDRANPDVVARIAQLRDEGKALADIAAALTKDGVPTSQGGERWWPSSVAAVLRRAQREGPGR